MGMDERGEAEGGATATTERLTKSLSAQITHIWQSRVEMVYSAGMAIQVSPVDMEKRKALDIRPGDTVRVTQKIPEKGKFRLQVFEGLILARKHGSEAGGTFTVRKVLSGV